MRILRAWVRNYRVHADSEVEFNRDLTVLHGPNESGKSTLVEAVHRALFLSHRVGGQVREGMLRMPAGGHPEVELELEGNGGRWTLRKRFGGSAAGEIHLKDPEGRVLTGSEAEARLAQLVGTEPVSSGGGAARALRERWGHLWVWQGTAGENLLSLPAGPAAYEHGKLVARLQEVGELSVQSALDREVMAEIEDRWSSVFTPTGQVRAGSDLRGAREDLASLREQRDRVRERLDAQEEAQRLHADATGRLLGIEAELRQVEARLGELDTGLRKARELEQELGRERELLEPRRTEMQALEGELGALEAARASVEEVTHALGPRLEALDALRKEQAEMTRRRSELRDRKERADRALEEIRAEHGGAEAAARQIRLAVRVRELEGARAVAEERRIRRAVLEERLAEIPPMTESKLKALRDRMQARELVRAELRSLATGVRAVRAGISVELDGERLSEGELRRITDRTRLTVGDAVELELIPGRGSSAREVRERMERAESAVVEALERLGVSDAEEASGILAHRQALEREKEELEWRAADHDSDVGGGDVARELGEARAELRKVEDSGELEPPALPKAGDPETHLRDLVGRRSRDLERIQVRLRAAEQEATGLQSELDTAQEALDGLTTRIEEGSHELKTLEGRKRDAEGRVGFVLEKHGSPDALRAAIEAARKEVEAFASRVSEREAALGERDAAALEEERRRVHADRARLVEAKEQVRSERDRQGGRLEAAAAGDLDAESERLAAALDDCGERVSRLEREAATLQLLRDLFEEEQNRMATEFSGPLQQSMEGYLACVLPEASTPGLAYESGRGFHDLTWRRGEGVAWGVDALSCGAREQLMAALRLAMAEVLGGIGPGRAGEGRGSASPEGLPVVFDDAFVNADPRRMQGIVRMLERAADRGLQLLVFTCDPKAWDGAADGVKVAMRE